ncbi:UNVERIFIED_CONTAM: hypothetical protein RMT77_013038 [Armadillidium vulgare]
MSRLLHSCKSSKCSNSSSEEEDDNGGPQYEAEIWIYTKSSHIYTTARDKLLNSKGNQKLKDSLENFLVSVFLQWILVAKFDGSTLWMEASDINGILQTDILDSEPEDIENRVLIGTVKASIPKMMQLFSNNKLIGKNYSLSGANCHSLIKDIIKELGINKELKIINDIFDITAEINSHSNSKIAPEIWIYTRSVKLFSSSRS